MKTNEQRQDSIILLLGKEITNLKREIKDLKDKVSALSVDKEYDI